MKVLDLYAGLEGWSTPFRERGHDVKSLDINPDFTVDIHADVFKWEPLDLLPWSPDIILASPPCEAFSVMNIGRNWTKPTDEFPNQPKTPEAVTALDLVWVTRDIIATLEPTYFVIENPRAKLRRLAPVADLRRETVWYCHYGLPFAKPTDLWGVFPESWVPRPPCHNGCDDHNPAPRGSTTGIQGGDAWVGKDSPGGLAALRAEVPYQLALEVCLAAEQGLQ